MPRNKKKRSASAEQRRQEEIQKRIGRAAENAEKKRSKAKAKAAEPAPAAAKAPEPAPASPKEPASKPAPRRGRAKPRYEQPAPSMRKILSIGEDGSVRFPERLGLSDLFKAIRNDDPSGSGHLYISLDGTLPEAGACDLSYVYKKGLFTRVEALAGRKSGDAPPVLADLLDARVRTLYAKRDEDGGTGWYAGVTAVQA